LTPVTENNLVDSEA